MKKVSLFSIIVIIILNIFSADISTNTKNIKPIRAGVLLYSEDDYYISEVRDYLLKIENENKEI